MAGIFDVSGAGVNGGAVSGANMSGGAAGNSMFPITPLDPRADPISAQMRAYQARQAMQQATAMDQDMAFRKHAFDAMQNQLRGASNVGAAPGLTGMDALYYSQNPGVRDWMNAATPEQAERLTSRVNAQIKSLNETDPARAQDLLNMTTGNMYGLKVDRANNPASWEAFTDASGKRTLFPKALGLPAMQEQRDAKGNIVYAPIDQDKVLGIAEESVAAGGKVTPAMRGALSQYMEKVMRDADNGNTTNGVVNRYTKNTGDVLSRIHTVLQKSVMNASASPAGVPQEPGALPGGATPSTPATPTGVKATGQRPAASVGNIGVTPGASGLKTVKFPGPGNASSTFAPSPADTKEADDALGNSEQIHATGKLMADNWDPRFFTTIGQAEVAALKAKQKYANATLTPEESALIQRFGALESAMGKHYGLVVHDVGGSRVTESVKNVVDPTLPHDVGSFDSWWKTSNGPDAAAAKFKSSQILSALNGSLALASKYSTSGKDDQQGWAQIASGMSKSIDARARAYIRVNPGMPSSLAVVKATNDVVNAHHTAWAKKYNVPSLLGGQ